MKPVFGITGKLFAWFSVFMLMFYITILILYLNVQKIVKISENIVNKNYEISSVSKRMIDNLITMENNEKKYHLLKKDDYVNYFISARKEYEGNFNKIFQMESEGNTVSPLWNELYKDYRGLPDKLRDLKTGDAHEAVWIPEKVINEWIQTISTIRAENEQDVQAATRELNQRGRLSARNGLIGLGISSLVGLIGLLFLSYSMVRPLKELLKGIRSIPNNKSDTPVPVISNDEFGELAVAFNEMAIQLKKEELMRSDFISMLSHEIRTPLTSIRESVNLTVEEVMGTINERQKKFLEIASKEIGRICDLLNHLMQVSRLESGALMIQRQSVDTALFISTCVNNLKHVAEAKTISIETHIPPDIPSFMGDPKHLQQVFHNLLDNALKFSDHGSRISIQIEPDMESKSLVFSVSDTGPGIPEEEQGLIFSKYYQAVGDREHADGVGLGLNISKKILEAHAGTVWVSSKIGRGSTFFFRLPIASEES